MTMRIALRYMTSTAAATHGKRFVDRAMYAHLRKTVRDATLQPYPSKRRFARSLTQESSAQSSMHTQPENLTCLHHSLATQLLYTQVEGDDDANCIALYDIDCGGHPRQEICRQGNVYKPAENSQRRDFAALSLEAQVRPIIDTRKQRAKQHAHTARKLDLLAPFTSPPSCCTLKLRAMKMRTALRYMTSTAAATHGKRFVGRAMYTNLRKTVRDATLQPYPSKRRFA